MKMILKYKLTGAENQEIKMPLDSEILSVQVQDGKPCIWAMISSNEPTAIRKILVIRTGDPVTIIFNYKFIGTVQFYEGKSVLHFFDAGYKTESE